MRNWNISSEFISFKTSTCETCFYFTYEAPPANTSK